MRAITRCVVGVLGAWLFLWSVPPSRAADEPLYEGLGKYSRKVTAASPEAEKYVNQGLAFLYGFNHGAAIRSFERAARLDPTCAMAHWGIAVANGPHINFPLVPPPQAEIAWKELQLAKQHAGKCTQVEKDLIEALSARYANPQPEDRAPLDRAYADAMRKVWQKHPADPDVGVFFAEALMDLSPWNQWTKAGEPQPNTEEVIATLDAVLKLEVNHPFANHLYIHAVEASQHPDRANVAADRLRGLQPGLAHNVHMPSHIDIRNGRWQQAIDQNAKAIVAAENYRKIVGPAKGMLIVYDSHNRHMLAYAALMTGQRELAVKEITAMRANIPEDFLKDFSALAEGFAAMPDEVLVRFGQWDTILDAPQPDRPYTPFTNAFHHGARAIAFAAKGDTASARAEQKLWADGVKKIPEGATFGNNTVADLCALASAMIEGEVLLREGKTEDGLSKLREAVKLEDALKYDEPPGWMIPARHSLGAFLLKAGKTAEAEQVYRDDLKKLPDNGWSLYGLAQSLKAQDKREEATTYEAKFQKVWAKADTKIKSSCLCQEGVTSAP
jgi:tetratricopeptide (TPR) repeat protein